jgi:hypothetical protein
MNPERSLWPSFLKKLIYSRHLQLKPETTVRSKKRKAESLFSIETDDSNKPRVVMKVKSMSTSLLLLNHLVPTRTS